MKSSLKVFGQSANFWRLLSIAVWWLFLPTVVYSQTISGIVTDQNKAPIQNAEIKITFQDETKAQTVSDAEGRFSIAALQQIGARLTVKFQGFAAYSAKLPLRPANQLLSVILQPEILPGEVTVSINRTTSRLAETPASIVVLDREKIAVSAAQATDDILRQAAGFTLFRRSSSKTSNPTAQGANLRGVAGSGAARTAVLVDGLSLNDAFGGWTYWSRVPPIAVDQIEVLRGGASTFYGNAGLGGAVNLQMRSAGEKPLLDLQFSGGTQKTFDASLFASAAKKGWSITAALENFQTGGYIPVAENERGIVDTNARSRHQNAILTIEKKLNVRARTFLKTNLFSESRDNGTSLTTNRTYFRQLAAGTDLTESQTGSWQFRTFFEKQVYDQTFSAVTNNRQTENLSRIQRVPSQNFGANIFWTKAFGGRHTASSSVEFNVVKGFSNEIIFLNNLPANAIGAGGTRQTVSIFGQDFWRLLPKFSLNLGGRLDLIENSAALSATRNLASNQTNPNAFSDRQAAAFSPRVAALYQISRNFSLAASYTNSFRAPTLNELYRAFRVGNVLTLANENLKNERAATIESGVFFTGFKRRLSLRGNLFQTKVNEPVVAITQSATANLITRQRQNLGQTKSRGFEIDGEYAFSERFRLTAAFLFTDSRVTKFLANPQLIGKFLPQVARHQLTSQIIYRPIDKLTFAVQNRLADAQFEDELNTLRLRPYAVFDVFASYKLNKIEVFTAAENVFNRRYDIGLTPNRTVAAPAAVRLGLRLNLGRK